MHLDCAVLIVNICNYIIALSFFLLEKIDFQQNIPFYSCLFYNFSHQNFLIAKRSFSNHNIVQKKRFR